MAGEFLGIGPLDEGEMEEPEDITPLVSGPKVVFRLEVLWDEGVVPVVGYEPLIRAIDNMVRCSGGAGVKQI